jgi:hypothetical protein
MSFWKRKADELLNHNRIPIEQAKLETGQWREIYAQKFGGEHQLIKAFFIPKLDLKCLLRRYRKYKPTGARAYIVFRLDDNFKESGIRIVLVPATETEDFYDKGKGKLLDGTVDSSSVYDFTMPCPDVCAANNPLNSNPQV